MKNKQLEESVPKQKLVKEATTVGVSSVTVCQQRYVTHQLCSLGAFELFPLLTKGFCCSRQPLSPWRGSQLEAVQQQQHQVHPEVRISACSPGLSRPWFGFPAHSYCFSCCPEDADTRCWFFFFLGLSEHPLEKLSVPDPAVCVMRGNKALLSASCHLSEVVL